jgi:hypothetical protein
MQNRDFMFIVASLEISQAKALAKFPGSRAAQEAARKKKLDYIGMKQGVGFFPGFVSDPL